MAALDALGIHHSGREGTVASFVANGRRIAMVAFAPTSVRTRSTIRRSACRW
jgi:hypothetical protein